MLAATAVTASAINIGGGFTITQRMLDMFRWVCHIPLHPIELAYKRALENQGLHCTGNVTWVGSVTLVCTLSQQW